MRDSAIGRKEELEETVILGGITGKFDMIS
jgi:hypothetical protein